MKRIHTMPKYRSAISHKPIDIPFDPPIDLDLQLREVLSRA